MRNKCNILLTSAGRRVSLVKIFKDSIKQLGIDGDIHAGDVQDSAPALFESDKRVILPLVSDPEYIPFLLKYCLDNEIKAVVPLIDPELTLLAKNKDKFEKNGTKVLVSSDIVTETFFDKRKTASFFEQNSILTPRTFSADEVRNIQEFPVLLKPAFGSSAVGVVKIKNRKELDFFMKYTSDPIVQEFIEGREFTIDVYVNFENEVKCCVPRERLAIRAGEVSKAKTVNNDIVISSTKNLVSKLPEVVGCITVQGFLTKDGQFKFIEINPRFGGGFPLSAISGANFPLWILQELSSLKCEASQDAWSEDVVMLRYDAEVVCKASDAGV